MQLGGFEKQGGLRGYALLLVLAFTGISMFALSGALTWTASNAKMTDRNNQYFTSVAAAEAATEKVLARISQDYQYQGESLVYSSLSTYSGMVPTCSEAAEWEGFEFRDDQGRLGRTKVDRITDVAFVELNSQYAGLRGVAATYRLVSSARKLNTQHDITAAVKQDIQVASIPLFQFAIFYNPLLEIHNGPRLNITGRVHCNANLYADPINGTVYQGDVTSAGSIVVNKRAPKDPRGGVQGGSVTFQKEHDSFVRSLVLPIGTNNTPAAVHAVVEIPPADESVSSAMGRQRYYNKADMVMVFSNASVMVKSGAFNNFATTIPYSQVTNFVSTNVSFYNKRESKTVDAIQINVGALSQWSQTNQSLRPAMGNRDIRTLYVADRRTLSSSRQSGVRLVNGQTLPALGLTVATPNPLYIQGNYNCPTAALGTTNTANTLPASVVCDALNILSTVWNDAKSSDSMSNRKAQPTTVNAAILTGIVESDGVAYSGGVENLPRFLEDWSNVVFTYNGSMVVMYPSQFATGRWGSSDVYSPPTRNWAFDVNFLNPTRLPPATPELRVIIRGEWALTAPGAGSS